MHYQYPDTDTVQPARAFIGTDANLHPKQALARWSPDQLAAKGVRIFREQPVPPGMRPSGPCVDTDTGTEILRTWPDQETDPAHLATLITRLCAQVDSARDERMFATVSFQGHSFSVDACARADFTGTETRLNAGMALPEGFVWRTTDNTMAAMDEPTLRALIENIYHFTLGIYQSAWAKKDAIRACTAVAELEALQDAGIVDAGWPDNDLSA